MARAPRLPWSQEEKDILFYYVGDYKIEDVIALYNQHARRNGFQKRTRSAIISLLCKLGVNYKPKYENLSRYQWAKLLGIPEGRITYLVSSGVINMRWIGKRSILHSRELQKAADVAPHLFRGAKVESMIYLFGEERAQELVKARGRGMGARVKHIPTGKVYPSLSKAAAAHHFHYSTLWKEMAGKKKPSGRWEFLD